MDFKCEINEVKTLSNGDTVEILEYSFIPAKSMEKLSSSQLRLKLNFSGRIILFRMVNQPSGGFSLIQAEDATEKVIYKSVKWSIHDLCKVIGAQIHYNDEQIEELIRLVIRIRRYLMSNIKERQLESNCDKKVWWVNQGDSQKAEKSEEVLWAPQKSADGKSLYHWDTMMEVQQDDIVLHYSNGALRYVSRVISQAVESQQPEALKNAYYGRDGNLVKLEYHELIPEININTIMNALKNSNIEQGPFNANGGTKQGYLFRFTIAAMQLIKQAQPETSWPAFTDVEDVTPMQNYWIFQGNPKVFKVVDGLRNNAIKTWYVAAHKQKIKEGDKVIIWVTGAQAGCYALAKVTSGVHMVHEESPEYSVDPTEESTGYEGCEIEIEYLLADCPILKTEIAGNEELADLNVGYQGTNFTATKDQYLELERMAKEHLANAEGAPKFALNKTYTLEHLCEDTGFEPAEASQWIRSIQRKGQAILYGPPGTGKTFVAEHLAKLLLSEGDGCNDLVQFHPAYSYEDFIQGIRPITKPDGSIAYSLLPGRFLEFCNNAKKRTGNCVLIIDEINRANLSRVFGELMYLLEYRDKTIPLAGGGSFEIPKNVFIIGTMNTADRSIALVDHALRRRFAFLQLQPKFDILRKFHEGNGFDCEGLIQILSQVNRQIGDKHYEIGISFFMRKTLTTELEDIWTMEIEPYLEEYFADQPEKIRDFRWDAIKDKIQS